MFNRKILKILKISKILKILKILKIANIAIDWDFYRLQKDCDIFAIFLRIATFLQYIGIANFEFAIHLDCKFYFAIDWDYKF